MDHSHFTTIVGESAIAESEGSHLFVALARSGGFRPQCGPPIATLTFFGTYTTSLRSEHSPTAEGIIAFDSTDQFSEGDIGTFEVKKLNGPAYDIEVKITHIRKKGMNGVFKPDVVFKGTPVLPFENLNLSASGMGSLTVGKGHGSWKFMRRQHKSG